MISGTEPEAATVAHCEAPNFTILIALADCGPGPGRAQQARYNQSLESRGGTWSAATTNTGAPMVASSTGGLFAVCRPVITRPGAKSDWARTFPGGLRARSTMQCGSRTWECEDSTLCGCLNINGFRSLPLARNARGGEQARTPAGHRLGRRNPLAQYVPRTPSPTDCLSFAPRWRAASCDRHSLRTPTPSDALSGHHQRSVVGAHR